MSLPTNLAQAIEQAWRTASLDATIGTLHNAMIGRGETAQCCVILDGTGQPVPLGRSGRGHDRIRKRFVVVGEDPPRIRDAIRQIYEAFDRRPDLFLTTGETGTVFGACAVSPKECQIRENRLPSSSAKHLFNGEIEFMFRLTREVVVA